MVRPKQRVIAGLLLSLVMVGCGTRVEQGPHDSRGIPRSLG